MKTNKSEVSAQLSWSMAGATLLFAVFMALALAGLDLWRDAKADQAEVERLFELVRDSSVEPVADALWNYNRPALGLLGEGVMKLKDVSRVQIFEKEQSVVALGQPVAAELVREYPLVHDTAQLGRLVVAVDSAAIRRQILGRFGKSLASKLLLTLCVATFVMFLLERNVMRYLRQAASFVHRRNSGNLEEVLRFQRKKWLPGNDELDVLAAGFAAMQAELNQTIASLQRDILRREAVEAALHKSEARLTAVFQTSPIGICVSDLESQTVQEINQYALNLLGYRADELIGKTFTEVGVSVDEDKRNVALHALSLTHAVDAFALDYRRKGGALGTAELSARLLEVEGERFVVSMWLDVTERNRTEQQLRKLSMAVEQSPVAIVITNTRADIEYANQAFLANSGYAREEVLGKNPRMLQSGQTPPETYAALWAALTEGKTWTGELFNRRKDGSLFVESAVIAPIFQANGAISSYVAVKDDITERKAAEQQIHALAYYDQLTGLPNRRLLIDRLQQTLMACARNQRSAALLYMDLDNFKMLNDNLGHDTGDALLRLVASRLIDCVRDCDTVARLGGDEFVVLIDALSDDPLEAATQARIIGDKVLLALSEPYQLDSYVHRSTSSIGVAMMVQGNETVDDLLKQADLAMYQSKSAGRNTLRFFDPQMQAAVTARAEMEEDLREALLRGEFELHYQAQVVGSERLTGAEALVRWQHPRRGMVSPAKFIPVAEETGQILLLGQWVLRTACQQLARWSLVPTMQHLTLAVNVSSRQFKQPGFVNEVLSILAETGASPLRLKLELTESLLVDDVEDVIAKMITLKSRGIGFSLDDFGTGYSSLSYLKRLPLDQLKIDQGFVRDILTDPNDAAIAKMVVALAESMGLSVIAEGVEIEAQRDYLASLNCHAYQGYLFAKPLPVAAFESFATR